MQLSVMAAAERHGELVADFETQGSGLRKTQVMRIGRLTSADKTGLRSDEPQMGFVTQPFGFGNGQNALVDPVREEVGCGRDKRRSSGLLLWLVGFRVEPDPESRRSWRRP